VKNGQIVERVSRLYEDSRDGDRTGNQSDTGTI
jgi:hypothetical protein